MMNRAYIDAVRLLLEVAPEVFREPVFALKGGTAINLFLHDMPRLSVDLDLVFIDHQPGRDGALQRIGTALAAASAILESRGMRCARGSDAEETKLFVERDRVRVKIEVSPDIQPPRIPPGACELRARLVIDVLPASPGHARDPLETSQPPAPARSEPHQIL